MLVRLVLPGALALAAWMVTESRQALLFPAATPATRMSLHNRILLNRAAVSGLETLEVMLLTADGRLQNAVRVVERTGGRIAYSDADIGYLRVEVPIERLLAVVSDPTIHAYQIASLSKAAWYRDTPPRANAEMFREFDASAPGGQISETFDLPVLPLARAREPEFTADDDMGLRTWFAKHPSFDGRGVTIAFLETAQAELSHPIFNAGQGAKLAGILNAIDPDDPDDTRVELDLEVRSSSTWCRIGSRTYILPRPGTFRFGLFTLPAGANLVHQFGVLRDQTSGDTWIDANGNADFRDEPPLADVNERVDVRTLKLRHPRAMDLTFVAGMSRRANGQHIYVARGDHQTMTVSVAAGSRTADGFAYGVAPGARVFLVRTDAAEYRLRHVIEGYLQAARHPGIDIIAAATGFELVPDTDADFAGTFFGRLVAVWRKPIFQSAGNRQLWMNSASSLGDVFSVGGTLSPETFAAFYGGGALDERIVHPSSAAGPAIDGRVKPDFLAPTHRIAAGLWTRPRVPVPRNHPTHQLPPGYQVGCCTSASSNFAAGLAALLLSGLRQEGIPYSFERLNHALRMGSHFLENSPANQQGNGLLNVGASWNLLEQNLDVPVIAASAAVVHPLAAYATGGSQGRGLFEWQGWTVGGKGRRDLRLRRASGPPEPVKYRISWTGNDGTFTSPESVVLPLNTTASLPIDIAVLSAGGHSALLNLHDASDMVVFRTQATVVATESFGPRSNTLRLAGSVALLRKATHYITIPAGVEGMSIELEVLRGGAGVNLIASHGLFPAYQGHVGPQNGRTFTGGRYSLALPHPSAGTWTIDVSNTSTRRERNPQLVSDDIVEYTIVVRLYSANLRARRSGTGSLAVDIENHGADIREPVLLTAIGELKTHKSQFLRTGLPNLFPIEVPEGSSTLALDVRANEPGTTLELHLYDCSSGECFSHNYTIPAAAAQRLTVRRPSAGKWMAAVNSAPSPAARGGFVLREVIAGQVRRSPSSSSRHFGERWTEVVELETAPQASPGTSHVVLCEIVDGHAERDERERLWEIRDNFPKLPNSPVASGSTLLQLLR